MSIDSSLSEWYQGWFPKAMRLLIENPWIPADHQPTHKQAEFLLLPHIEALYGGAAGGGKSDALLMGALQFVEVPDYAALLLRRTYADLALPEALMDRAAGWLTGTAAKWSEKDKTWTFPSGATVTFGYLESENDKYRYQSAAFQYIGFDELTQFTETQYLYLFSRLRRRRGVDVPLRMRAASNPGGAGHEWVRRRVIDEGETHDRPFVRAALEDNPHLDIAEYDRSLAKLDPVTRAQLRHGDWSVQPAGNMFKREWFEIVQAVPYDARPVRYWDLAATEPKAGKDPDWTAGVRMAEKAGVFYVEDVRRTRATPMGVEALIKQTAELDGRGVAIYMEREPGSSGVNTIDHYAREVLVGFAFRGIKTTGSKLLRASPLSAAAEAGNVKLLRGAWIGEFLDELVAFPAGAHDDQADAASGAHEQLTTPTARGYAGKPIGW
jgi:predicted phage terminase large subunit-like protein